MQRTVRKTTLDLNIELLARAQQALGTKGIKDTIDRALYDAIVSDARRRTIAHLRSMDPIDSDELRRQAWRE